jgi:hypothetical protein
MMSGFDPVLRYRAAQDIQHPRCAILPSPDKLNSSFTSPGLDKTDTQGDLNKIWEWLRRAGFLNTPFFNDVRRSEQLHKEVYGRLINLAFGMAFDPIRNTYYPVHNEMVLLYYTGHGLTRLNAANGLPTSRPNLASVGFSEAKLKKFAKAERRSPIRNRTVKGGELCLHHVGYCDLQGLLTPWIAAVTEESIHARGHLKQNKHLVVIADSCYSGVLVEELRSLADFPNRPWNTNGCTVTVQSACSSDQLTVGGYFTPLFIYLNENTQMLRQRMREWIDVPEAWKNWYRLDPTLPSPQVATTMMPLNQATMITVLPTIQGVQLKLFHDAGFFKFCFRKEMQRLRINVQSFLQLRLSERSTRMSAYVQQMQQNQ